MGLKEIERKFLVKNNEYKALAVGAVQIKQGYISSVPERTVRVRIRDDQGFITIKGHGNASGTSRFEWEKGIAPEDAQALLGIAEPGIIDKTRYLVPNTDGKHIWEVDVFHGEDEGLVIAEIELGSEDEAFDKPAWIGEEVTGDERYYNAYLAKNPFKNWGN
ncbi:MAG: CYTH domain-containing protein [Candidatus Cryptobacteroides sp.]|nr:CYTH domain-containing protein [Candidatus Cryptobacteroides sp.]